MQDTNYQAAKQRLFEMSYFAIQHTGITPEQFRERFEANVTEQDIQLALEIMQESKLANRRLGAEAVQSGDDSKVLFSLDDI